MAERRMFAKSIIDSDAFLDMPITARLLYYDLAMRADDDGFVNAPKKIMKFVGASADDLSILILRKFILDVGDGVVVIKHWRIHNYIQNDRYKETTYIEKKALLELDDNRAYKQCIQSVSTLDTHISIDKNSIDKNSINNNKRFAKPTQEEISAYIKENNYKVDAERFYDFYESKGWMVGKNHMKDWKACVRTWNNKNKSLYDASEMETEEQNIEDLKRRLYDD